jgi:hypothetical protein
MRSSHQEEVFPKEVGEIVVDAAMVWARRAVLGPVFRNTFQGLLTGKDS